MKRIIILILALASVSSVEAQVLTLEQCRAMALENNARIDISQRQLDAAKNTLKATRANFLPRLSATANWLATSGCMEYNIPGGYLPTFTPDLATGELIPNVVVAGGKPVVGPDGLPVFNQYAYFPGIDLELKINTVLSTSVRLEQPIYMGGKIRAGYKATKVGVALAGLNQQLTRDQVILECDQAYWNCLRAEAMIEALELYKSTVEMFYEDITNAVEVGMKTNNDKLKVKVTLNEAELNLTRARNASRLAQMNLCHVVGLPLTQVVELDDPETDDVTARDDDFDARERVEYQMLDKQLEISRHKERVVRADFLPNIGVAGMGGYTNGVQLNNEKLFNDISYGGMVSVSIPIFHWGEGRNKVRAQRNQSEMLRLERDDAALKMTLEANQARNMLVEAQLEAEFVVQAQQQAQENVRVTKNSYDAGRETLSALLEAQAIWQKALTDAVDSQARLRIAQTKYLKAMGRLGE